ncbi:MAG: hypothetical protein ACI9ZV_000285 [Candidatus Azotimanducaceae bacterium]|jgi:hypothetical protein
MTTCKNRKGQTYYLKVGTTKTGKPRYYASTDPNKGENAEVMPAGYVFRENVNGQVSVGKLIIHQIEDSEIECVQSLLDTLRCANMLEVKGESIIIHTAEVNEGLIRRVASDTRARFEDIRKSFIRDANYQAMLRFNLIEQEKRLFQIERMSFRGMGGWIWIDSSAPLKKLARKFIPLLDDTEKLFEEYY